MANTFEDKARHALSACLCLVQRPLPRYLSFPRLTLTSAYSGIVALFFARLSILRVGNCVADLQIRELSVNQPASNCEHLNEALNSQLDQGEVNHTYWHLLIENAPTNARQPATPAIRQEDSQIISSSCAVALRVSVASFASPL